MSFSTLFKNLANLQNIFVQESEKWLICLERCHPEKRLRTTAVKDHSLWLQQNRIYFCLRQRELRCLLYRDIFSHAESLKFNISVLRALTSNFRRIWANRIFTWVSTEEGTRRQYSIFPRLFCCNTSKMPQNKEH